VLRVDGQNASVAAFSLREVSCLMLSNCNSKKLNCVPRRGSVARLSMSSRFQVGPLSLTKESSAEPITTAVTIMSRHRQCGVKLLLLLRKPIKWGGFDPTGPRIREADVNTKLH
jgi:hypothetical protein